MRRSMRVFILISAAVVVSATIAFASGADASSQAASQPGVIRGLMIVGGIAHDFNAEPLRLAEMLRQQADVDIRVTADLGEITEENLARVDVVLFNTCLDKGLGEAGQKALLAAMRQGKGLVAMHCALYCFQDWPEWRKIVGGLVLKHDKFGPYEDGVVYPMHPIAKDVPSRFSITDEAYYVDERSPDICVIVRTVATHPGRPGPDPQVWTNRYLGGRICVTAMGHDQQALFSPAYLRLLANGIRWAAGKVGPPTMLSPVEKKEGFIPLFDGKTLSGWRYDAKLWKVQEGVIVGDTHPKPLQVNSCAIADGRYGDFILRYSVKFVSGNTGVQFRSQELPELEVAGYQEDIVPLGWGNLHEQNGRGRLVDGWTRKGEYAANVNDWNDMEVEAKGRRIILKTNGVATADYMETDETKPLAGIVALQLHRGDPMEVQFTNIRIKPLDASRDSRK